MATPLSDEARRQANLKILQRKDSSICDILASATHVGLYEYTMNQWEKKPVEGSLFLVIRQQDMKPQQQQQHELKRHGTKDTNDNAKNPPIQYQLQILNRLSTDHWTMPIVDPTMQLQQQEPYLILRFRHEEKTVIQGLWFPNAQERTVLANELTRLLPTLSVSSSINSLQTTSTPTATGSTRTPTPSATAAAVTALLSPLTLGGHVIPVSMAPSNSTSNTSSPPNTTSSSVPPGNLQSNPQPSLQSPSTAHVSSNSLETSHLVLDKRSLQLTLLSLLQDDRFLDLIHVQYLKVAHARANRNNEEATSSKTFEGER
jgi:mRNA-decapping enzyme 1B